MAIQWYSNIDNNTNNNTSNNGDVKSRYVILSEQATETFYQHRLSKIREWISNYA